MTFKLITSDIVVQLLTNVKYKPVRVYVININYSTVWTNNICLQV